MTANNTSFFEKLYNFFTVTYSLTTDMIGAGFLIPIFFILFFLALYLIDYATGITNLKWANSLWNITNRFIKGIYRKLQSTLVYIESKIGP